MQSCMALKQRDRGRFTTTPLEKATEDGAERGRQPQANGCQQPPEAFPTWRLPPEPPKGAGQCPHLHFRPALPKQQENTFCCFKSPRFWKCINCIPSIVSKSSLANIISMFSRVLTGPQLSSLKHLDQYTPHKRIILLGTGYATSSNMNIPLP